MPILLCRLELHLPHCHSLKEKRTIVQKAAGRLRARFNFSVSEVDHQDLWQRATLAAVSVGPDKRRLHALSESFIRESERILGGDLMDYDVEIFDYD